MAQSPIEDILPLSPLQEGLLFHALLDREAHSLYLAQFVAELRGPVDGARLRAAAEESVRRNANLRATFRRRKSGEAIAVVRGDVPLTWATVDLGRLRGGSSEEADRLVTEDFDAGFDIEDRSLIRFTLISESPARHRLVLSVHHILLDGWSTALFLREVFALYGGGSPAPVRPYRDYLAWLTGQDRAAATGAWRELLAGVTEPTFVAPEAAGAANGGAAVLGRPLRDDLTQALREAAQRYDVTLNTVFQAAWAIVLGGLTGRGDVVFGSTVGGRPAALPGADEMIGLFINTVPVTATVTSGTAGELVRAIGAQRSRLLDHDHLGLADIQRESGAEGALFDTTVVFDNFPMNDYDLALDDGSGTEVTGITFRDTAHYPLTLVVEPGRHYEVRLHHRPDVFDAAATDRVLDRLVGVLEVLAAPEDRALTAIDVLTTAERCDLLVGRNATVVSVDGGVTADELVAVQARVRPSSVALVSGSSVVSYGELDARAGALARHLVAAGVGRGELVGVHLDRGVDQVVAVLGVLKAGAGYAMLDTAFPAARIAALVGETGARVVIDERWVAEHAETAAPVMVLGRRAEPGDVACVMFTSGSTGRAKGVVAPHRALVGTFLGQSYASFGPGEVVLQCAPVSWDAFALELFGALFFGGTAVLHPGGSPEPAVIAELIAEHDVTTVHVSASLLNFLLDEYPGAFAGVREVMTGGEAASVAHIAKALGEYPGLRLVNGYSPVESMIFTLCHDVTVADTRRASIPVGRPIGNKRVFVLDEALRPVPAGVAGELYMAGVGLADGYLNQTALTATRFVANPFGGVGERMYRTGDLVRWNSDDSLDFIGRADGQVKIRGFRVEPGDVETVLGRHPSVTQVAVIVREDQPGDKRLVAYVTGEQLSPTELRAHTEAALPDYLVPSAFVVLDELPRTANGKLDHRALPTPSAATGPAGREPRSAQEGILAGLFAEVLGLPSVGVHDSFFDLGGHSLLAARLIARVRTVLGADLALRTLFHTPTVAGLATAVDGGRADRPVLRPGDRPERPALSPAQRRLWFLEQLEGAGVTYSVPVTLRLPAHVDQAALAAALADVVTRHEALRTLHPAADGEPYQLVLTPEQARPELTVVEVADAAELDAAVNTAAAVVLDVTTDLPLRATLFRGGPQSVLLLVAHHIVVDGWSEAVLLRDLGTAYEARRAGNEPAWAPLPVQYTDYARWAAELLAGSDAPEWWSGALAGLPTELALPVDRPRPAEASHRGGSVPFALDAEAHAALRTLAREQQVTLFMVVQAALAALLARLGAGEDVPLGTAVAGRSEEELDDLVGFFVNSVVLRTDVSGDPTFADLLARVREADLAAFAHQELPFDRLVELLNPERSLARHPLFQVMVVLQNNADAVLELDGHRAVAEHVGIGVAKFDLTVSLQETRRDGAPNGLTGVVEYAQDLFDDATVQALASRLARVLTEVAAEPTRRVSALDVLGDDDRRLLERWNDTAADYPRESTVHELFEARADATPHATALVFEGQRLSFGELDERANRLAQHLIGLGTRRGDLVAVRVERGFDLVTGLLGVLKAGAAYVPIDPTHPEDRIAAVLAEARPRVVVTAETVAASAACPNLRPAVPVNAGDTASVLFTSGSSGVPKGVASPHRATVRTFLGQGYIAFGPELVTLQCAPVSWDGLSLELWPALLHGGTCVLSPGQTPDPATIARLVPEHGVTTMWLSAGLFAVMLDEHPEIFGVLRQVMTGGEAPSVAHVLRARREFPALRLVHGYGPVESMVFTNCHTVTAADEGRAMLPVGPPLANTRVHVLDSMLQPVPAGVVGEVYAAGDGLAHGYANRPGPTAERFVAGPCGERRYRTGDLARWTPTGELEFAGRADDQVKIRGFRIEPAEIEGALAACPGVERAAVVVREDRPGDRRLVAYVVGTAESTVLRAHVTATLPSYLVPSAFVTLPELPLTPNGKLDRKALPAPGPATLADGRAPRTPVEEVLCGVFADVLGVARVSIDDSFFDLGGHSLLATRTVSRIRRVLGVELTVRDLFAGPTVSALATVVATAGAARPPLLPVARPERTPLSFAQQRLWFTAQAEVRASATYNVPYALDLCGDLDVEALTAALTDVVGRHEALRTVFGSADGEAFQLVLDDVRPVLTLEECPENELAGALRESAAHPIDLADPTGLPLRATLFRTAPERHTLLLVLHHIAGDGWSMGPLMRDLGAAYAARRAGSAPAWAPLPVQYADYALWQRSVLESELERELGWWTTELDGVPAELAMPADRPRPAGTGGRGSVVTGRLDAEVHARLTGLARQHGVSAFMVVQSALAVVLSCSGAGPDVPIGTAVAGRSDEALDDLVGFFVNSVVLRTDVSGDPTFADLLERVREADLAAFAHAEVPFDLVVEAVNPPRSLARHPLFQVMLTVQTGGDPAPAMPGLTTSSTPLHTGTAKFDLNVSVVEHEGLDLEIEFAEALFDAATAQRMLTGLERLLRAVADEPDTRVSAVDLVSDPERDELLSWGTGAPAGPVATVPELVSRWSGRALVFEGAETSYEELDAESNRLARALAAAGVTRGGFVAVRLPRGPELVVALLAALKTGAAYTLIDPELPAGRQAQVVSEVDARVVITPEWLTENPFRHLDDGDLEVVTAVDDAACVMFTSGSTGRAKGVVASHRALVGTFGGSYVDFGPGEVFLQCSPVSWDAFGLELFGALLHGGTVVLQPGQRPEPARIARLVGEWGVTMLQMSASLFNFMVDEYPDTVAAVSWALTGGEAASERHVAAACGLGVKVGNGYGPAESMGFTTFQHVTGTVSIGTPVAGKSAYVLDENLRPVPVGVVGEVYLAGVGLALGYLNRPGDTAARFVAGADGHRMYRTGDLARWSTGGVLEFAGRGDEQVKIRGFRVEPAEVEAALLSFSGVKQAAVIAAADPQGGKRLVAYVTGEATEQEVRRHAADVLPQHMVPAAVVVLKELPLTATGKLDKRALPEAELTSSSIGRSPRTTREALLCGIFETVLGRSNVSVDDNFFDLGGHSLLAARLAARVRTALGEELSIAALFAAPTVAGIAERLTRAVDRPALTVTERPEFPPLSFAQQRLWFLHQVEPDAGYNVPLAFRLQGALDPDALQAALGDVTARHETLRTTYPSRNGVPYQHVHPAEEAIVAVTFVDDPEAAARPFDLATEFPLRAHLHAQSPNDHLLLLVMHHIATDGWSSGPLLRDLATAYGARVNGKAPEFRELPLQYVDYATWQRDALNDGEAQLDHWQQTLADLPDELALPVDRPRPEVASHRGGLLSFTWDAELHRNLTAIAREHQVTVFMVVQAALATLLSRMGAGEDIPLGTAVAGRSDEQLDDLVGFFVNSLVLRTDVSGDPTFTELLARVQKTDLAAFDAADVPFDRVVEKVNPQRSLARHPLFQVLLVQQNTGSTGLDLPGLEVTSEPAGNQAAKFDLTLAFEETGDGVDAAFEYALDLFDEPTVANLATRLERLLTAAVADPSVSITELPIMDDEEREHRLALAAGPVTEYPREATVHGLFAAQAARTPDAPALIFDNQDVSYRELDEAANRVAHHLIGQGVVRGDRVGVLVPRGPGFVTALIGVLKAGAAYVPLDPSHPSERIAAVVEEAGARIVITETALGAAGTEPCTDPGVEVKADDLATVLFTSGSSGRPKGVASPHRATVRTFLGQTYLDPTPGVTLGVAPVSWDAFALELWSAMLRGGRCVLVPGQSPDPSVVARLVAEHGVTSMWLSAGLFAVMADEFPQVFTTPRLVMTGGEAPSLAHVRRVRRDHPSLRIVHGYGPVESMVFATTHEIMIDDDVSPVLPIGSPLANTTVHVLDARLAPVPAGVVGEVYVAGDGLAQCYLGRAALTAERFVADPSATGATMYRTGDLARWNDGDLVFAGRADDQVKLRGFRVEPREVEAVLAAHPAVVRAAVVVREDGPGGRCLVGYAVTADDTTGLRLRDHLSAALPAYLVPAAVVVLNDLPLTPNGKLDRRALPAPDFAALTSGREPRTPLEATLCHLFAEILGLAEIGIDDSFFELGGHSLLATRLISRIRAEVGVEVGIRDLFGAPTVAALAAGVVTNPTEPARPVLARRDQVGPVAPSFAQERLLFQRSLEKSAAYNIPLALRLTGRVDAQALRSAFEDVTARHEVLRTVFVEHEGSWMQSVVEAPAVALPVVPVSAAEVENVLTEMAGHDFDLTTDLPFHAALLTIDDEQHVLAVVLHHIAADGWSLRPLLTDLATAYQARVLGETPQWAPLPVQYADYALWQRELLAAVAEPQLKHWHTALEGMPAELALPTDRTRPATPGHRGGVVPFELDAELHARLVALAHRHGVTVFMVLQAGLAALLTRLGAGTDIPIGAPVAGRSDEALDDLVGFFVNTLVLRTDVSGDPAFGELLARVKETTLAAVAHQDVPFEQVVEAVNPERSLARHPLFQVMLVLQNNAAGELRLGDVVAVDEPVVTGAAKFDLTFGFAERVDESGVAAGIDGQLEYAEDLFELRTANSVAQRLVRLLEAVSLAPEQPIGDADVLTTAERCDLLVGRNATVVSVDGGVTADELVAVQARVRPSSVALVSGSSVVSYGELDARAGALARHLVAAGVGRGELVGVHLDRGVDQVVAVLGVLKAGAGYAMLDTAFPAARIAALVGETGARVVIDERWVAEHAETAAPVMVLGRRAEPGDVACVMFTSGSTGRAKGVVAPHRALVGTFLGQSYASFGPGEVVLQCAPVSWDAFALELFGALFFGGTAVLHPGGSPEPAVIAELIAEHDVTTVHVSASLLNFLLDEYPGAFAGVREVMTGGEAASVAHIAKALGEYPGLRLVNGYSPVESMIFTLCHDVTVADTRRASIPVGRPIGNKRVFVLDEALRPVPAGVAGELYMAGVGLADGYLNQTALTATRFVANPFGGVGERMYRTGDLVRWNSDDSLDFIGRADGQVKIRGFRVEPGDVETVLGRHPSVTQVAVIVREDQPGDKRLVAYVTGEQLSPTELRAHTEAALPDYLVPSAFVVLDELPRTANGKLDHRALPTPELDPSSGGAPRTPEEEILAGLFADVLGLPSVGVHDSFFDLGGHSLLGAKLISRVRSVLAAELSIRDLFRTPTVAGLAGRLTASDRPPLRPRVRPATLPLSYAQQRLWFLNRLDEAAAYNVPVALRLRGELDEAALAGALTDVVARHEVLRTMFPATDGQPVQVVVPMTAAVAEAVRPAVVEVTPASLPGVLEAATRVGFDLTAELPVRTTLFRLGAQEHVLLLVMHHVAGDGWSMGPLMRDLSTAYTTRRAGNEPAWAPLPVQYADFTLWQHDVLGAAADPGSRMAGEVAWWHEALAGMPDELDLPRDRPRPAVSGHEGDLVPFELDADLHTRLLRIARQHGVSLFMVLQAALATVLSRSGAGVGTDVPIGAATAGRTDEALDDLVGFFVNSVVLRTDVSGDPTFADLLARVREADLAAFAHAEVPFDLVVEAVNPERTLARHPLFQVMLVLQNAGSGQLDLPGLEVSDEPFGLRTAKFDLTVAVGEEAEGGLRGALEYATDLFDRSTVTALGARLERFLGAVAAEPQTRLSAVELLPAHESERLREWGSGAPVVVPGTVPELVSRWTGRALVFEGAETSYEELDARSNRTARALVSAGVGRGSFVAIELERGPELVVALLAALKTGAAYTLIDPELPVERRLQVVADVAAAVVITPEWLTKNPVDGFDSGDLGSVGTVDDAACVMFTSGSTGRAKGVVASHRALVGTFGGSYVDFGPGEVFLQCSPVSWDAFGLELFGALLHGGTVVLQPGQRPEPARIARLVGEWGVTMLQMSASLFNFMVDEYPDTVAAVSWALTGGEAASERHVAAACGLGVKVGNGYGPAESMGFTTFQHVTGTVSIGTPVAGKSAYVLDENLRPVPVGVVGEVYLAGVGLALGYLNRPGDTAARFVAGADGHRMYRTGDLARWSTGGVLEFAGRGDEQVKIRGFRVEPAEVEAALLSHENVRQAAVIATEAPQGGKRLVAYVTGDVQEQEVRRHAADVLPQHMVPAAVVVLKELPLTATGKLDKRALPEAELTSSQIGRSPRTTREALLCGIFETVLGRSNVSVDDNFFDLGGHSLLAARLAARVRAALGEELSIAALFAAPTVAGIAERLTRAVDRPALTVTERPEFPPLSFAQQRLWFLHQVEPDAGYNVPLAFRLQGALDPDALQAALGDVTARHETLRTTYPSRNGVPYQHVTRPDGVVLHRTTSAPDLEAAALRPFDLAHEVPLRAWLLSKDDEHVLLLVMHHIATDGWSSGPLLRDLATAYRARLDGETPEFGELPLQYADYAAWQRGLLDHGGLTTQLDHWDTVLADLPDELALPVDRPRPEVASHRGGLLSFTWDAELHRSLTAIAREHQVTVFMVVQAALATLLSRMGAGEDIPLGTAVAGRSDEQLDDLVGFFVNSLVLRTDVSGDPTFAELLARVQKTDLAAFDAADVPFDRVVEKVNPQRSLARHPLFQVLLVQQNTGAAALDLPGLEVVDDDGSYQSAKFDLTLAFAETHEGGAPAGVSAQFEYATDLFDHATVEALAARLGRVLAAALTDPTAPVTTLELMDDEDRTNGLALATGPVTEYPREATVHGLFAAQAARTPDAPALTFDNQDVTYRELDEAANRVAHHLIGQGVVRGDRVGVLVPRGPGFVTALIGVLKAGAAYVPLDPSHPSERIDAVVEEAGARIVITETALGAAGTEPCTDPGVEVKADDLATVLFTSGSSGRPKGVASPHRATVRTFLGQTYLLGEAPVTLQCAPVSWDGLALELWPALLHGGRCVLAPGQTPDPAVVAGLVAAQGVTSMWLSAGLFAVMADEYPQVFTALRHVMTGGEAPSLAHVRRVRRDHPSLRIVHGYGPVESMVFATTHEIMIDDDESPVLPIGSPLANTTVHVLDARLAPVPAGVVGEVYVAGDGLAHGYLGHAGLTAERFVADPFVAGALAPGATMYRTGDLARRNARGELVFVGRADDQVKIRGFRVEPREVEAVLAAHPAVVRAAVVVREDGPGGRCLVGYAVAAGLAGADLRDHLAAALPAYLVPAAVVVLNDLPLTPNGKLDRRALPAPDFAALTSGREPRTPLEAALCELFADVLDLDRVGIDDSFFDLGGHSLLATRLAVRISREFGTDVGVRGLFTAPTVARMADLLEAGTYGDDDLATLLPIRETGSRTPLFCLSPGAGIGWVYTGLVRYLEPDRPLYALQAPGLTGAEHDPASLEQLADRYVELIRSVQPEGPYQLLGWSFGGVVAQAVAVRLEAAGARVPLLAVLDGYPEGGSFTAPTRAADALEALLRSLGYELPAGEPAHEDLLKIAARDSGPLAALGESTVADVARVFAGNVDLLARFTPARFGGDLLMFTATEGRSADTPTPEAWNPHVAGRIDTHPVPSDHGSMTGATALAAIAPVLIPHLS